LIRKNKDARGVLAGVDEDRDVGKVGAEAAGAELAEEDAAVKGLSAGEPASAAREIMGAETPAAWLLGGAGSFAPAFLGGEVINDETENLDK